MIRLRWAAGLLIGLVASLAVPAPGQAADPVRAKIGMEIVTDAGPVLARARDRLNSGQPLRLYVVPEQDAYVYVINADGAQAAWINPGPALRVAQGTLQQFPSAKEVYQPDGSSSRERFTVICSPQPLAAIADLFARGPASLADWQRVEDQLIAPSRIDLSETADKPFSMAGTVRSLPDVVARLPISSGNGLVVKQYEFHVKK